MTSNTWFFCPGYCGVACVNGSCPAIAMEEEYGVYHPFDCQNCWRNEGCEDCYFADSDECVKNRKGGRNQ